MKLATIAAAVSIPLALSVINARAGDVVDGLALIYLYSKRCASFESLPLKTQEALREGLSVARNAIIDAAIKREEELKPYGSGMCYMIRQSFPSLL